MIASDLYKKIKTPIIRSQERIAETNEVFSSPELVKKMFNMWPDEVWLDPNGIWIEPTCGDGNILIAIYNNLMVGLKEWELDDIKRHTHIIENMIRAVDIMPDNVEHCIDRLNARHLKHNIVCANALTYDFSFGKSETECDGLLEIPTVKLPRTKPNKLNKKSNPGFVDSGLFG